MMRLFALLCVVCLTDLAARAQEIIGFPREDFGKVVLSSRQSYSGNLEASIGQYNNEPISLYSKRSVFSRLGQPVGRLDVLTNIHVFPCTGFLISKKYLLTNYHCVPGVLDIPEIKRKGATRIEGVQIVLGYTREGIEEEARRFKVAPVPVEASKDLDYSILEVSGNPSDKYGAVKISTTDPYDNQPFIIIGHPLGSSQRISREKCLSAAPALSGGRVRHKCDTLPGNSGSPVFDQDSRAAIALHHAGSKRNSINYAIPFSRIVKQSKTLQAMLQNARPKISAKPLDPPATTALSPAPCDGVTVSVATSKTVCIKPGSGRSFKDCAECSEMIVIPAARFVIGSPQSEKGRHDDEGPQAEVTVRQFAVSKHEISLSQFREFVVHSGYAPSAMSGSETSWCGYPAATGEIVRSRKRNHERPGFAQQPRNPVVCVSWHDAKAYTAWLSKRTNRSYRLLSEAEFEYIARAGTTTSYWWGESPSHSHAHFKLSNGKYSKNVEGTVVVDALTPNPWQLYHVTGNAAEWVEDCWNPRHRAQPHFAHPPRLLGDCSSRVIKGGGWSYVARDVRSAARDKAAKNETFVDVGFRVARDL